MESKAPIEINGEKYLLFASENVKRLLRKNKVAAVTILEEFINKPFTKLGTSNIKRVGETNLNILNIQATEFESQEEIKCFILHCVGNYTQMLPIYPKKWSVMLECGHKAIFDETVDYICKDHVVTCFKCNKNN